MTLETKSLGLGNYSIEIVKKKIKNIYFRVYPSKEKIIVSAPVHVDSKLLNKAILSKSDWLIKQVKKGAIVKPKPLKTYTSGEEFLFKGEAYTLFVTVQDTGAGVRLTGDFRMELFVKPGSDLSRREKTIDNWYRNELKRSIAGILDRWQPAMGVSVKEFGVRKMKTRWGSCNIRDKRIWLNFALIKLGHHLLEYVVVHEMVHLMERKHNARFKGFMDQFIPDWRRFKKELDLFRL